MSFNLQLIKSFFICIMFTTSLIGSVDYSKVITKLEFKGHQYLSHEDLHKNLQLETKIGQKPRELALLKDIQTLYLTGYYHHVEAHTMPTINGTSLQFIVSENPIIQDITFTGNTVFSSKKLKRKLKNKIGQILNISHLDQDKETIESYYHKKGFDLFKIKQMELTPGNVLSIVVQEGQIEDIQIQGLKQIKRFVVTRHLLLKNGDVFNSKVLRKDRERLLRLGYFSEVSHPKLIKSQNENNIIIGFKLKEKKVNRINLGLEQEEDVFLGFFQGILNHNVMHSDFLSGKIQVGEENNNLQVQSYSLKYYQPWIFNTYPISFTTDIWTEQKQEFAANDATNPGRNRIGTERIGGDIILGYEIIPERLKVNAKYKQEGVTPQDSNSILRSYKINSFTGSLSYRNIQNPTNPKRGSYILLEYEKGGNLGFYELDGLDFSRANITGATFLSLTKRTVIGFHSTVGILKPDSGNDTSSFEIENFIIGGASTIRGYKDSDFPFYGQRKIIYNLELRYDLFKKIQGVMFYDLGKAFNSGWDITSGLNKGAGIGIRFATPVGAVRFDLAKGSEELFLHFGLGQVF